MGAGMPPPPAARFVRLELPSAQSSCVTAVTGQPRFQLWQASTAPGESPLPGVLK